MRIDMEGTGILPATLDVDTKWYLIFFSTLGRVNAGHHQLS